MYMCEITFRKIEKKYILFFLFPLILTFKYKVEPESFPGARVRELSLHKAVQLLLRLLFPHRQNLICSQDWGKNICKDVLKLGLYYIPPNSYLKS